MEFPSEYTADEQSFVRSRLEPGEELVWVSKPKNRLYYGKRPSWLGWLFLAILCLVISYTAVVAIGLMFLYVLLCALPLLKRIDRHVFYVLTNRRAMILCLTCPSREREWRGAHLRVLDVKLHRENADFGDVVLDRDEGGPKWFRWKKEIGFLGVENPMELVELLEACSDHGISVDRAHS